MIMNRIRINRKFLKLGLVALIFVFAWGGYYAFRSAKGTYREDVQPGGVAYAIWVPKALNPLDLPLLILDRTFCHETVQTISGQGDMPRLFSISSDGKSLIPVAE